jgi:hypothetical protein
VSAYDQVHDAEAEANAAGLAREPLVHSIEAPKDPPLLPDRDAVPVGERAVVV